MVSTLSLGVNFTEVLKFRHRVVITPKQDMGNIRYWIEDVTVSGFTVKMSFTSTKNFDWIALEF